MGRVFRKIFVVIALIMLIFTGSVLVGRIWGAGPFSYLRGLAEEARLTEGSYVIEKAEYSCRNGANEITGTLYIPQDSRKERGIIILSHGLNGTAQDNTAYAEILAGKGTAVYTYDFCGGSVEGKSGGKTTEMSVVTEMSDLECVIELVKSWEWVDEKQVILMGQSQGGLVSAMVAAKRDDINSLVLLYPAFSLSDMLKSVFADPDSVPETFEFMGMELGKAYYEAVWDTDLYQESSGFTGNVLIIHGTRDTVVPYGSSKKMLKYYKNAELYSVQGADHGFTGEDAVHVIARICEFVEEQKDD